MIQTFTVSNKWFKCPPWCVFNSNSSLYLNLNYLGSFLTWFYFTVGFVPRPTPGGLEIPTTTSSTCSFDCSDPALCTRFGVQVDGVNCPLQGCPCNPPGKTANNLLHKINMCTMQTLHLILLFCFKLSLRYMWLISSSAQAIDYQPSSE